jgi:hypothetical protein
MRRKGIKWIGKIERGWAKVISLKETFFIEAFFMKTFLLDNSFY